MTLKATTRVIQMKKRNQIMIMKIEDMKLRKDLVYGQVYRKLKAV